MGKDRMRCCHIRRLSKQAKHTPAGLIAGGCFVFLFQLLGKLLRLPLSVTLPRLLKKFFPLRFGDFVTAVTLGMRGHLGELR